MCILQNQIVFKNLFRSKSTLFLMAGILSACFPPPVDPVPPPPVVVPPPPEEPALELVEIDAELVESGPVEVKEGPYQSGTKDIADVSGSNTLKLSIEGVIREDFPKKARAYVYVRDVEGNFISGMVEAAHKGEYPNDIWQVIQEQNGDVPCDPGTIEIEEFREETSPPRSVVFVADYSGSMAGTIGYVEQDIPTAIDELRFSPPVIDNWGFTKFDHNIKEILPVEQTGPINRDMYLYGLGELGGATALRDGILKGISQLRNVPADKERILIVFTDGYENSSFSMSWNMVLSQALANKVRIHAIGYGQVDKEQLLAIADRTGGSFYQLQESDDIKGVIKGIIHKTKVYYRITYTPCPDKGNRSLVLKTKVPNSQQPAVVMTYNYSQEKLDFGTDALPKVLVLFPFGSYNIKKALMGSDRLEVAATFLKENPNISIQLTGYTDSIGSKSSNRVLGLLRAKAVAKELRRLGVPRSQISMKSKGEENPIYDPDYPTEWMAAENRRVEFILLDQ